MKDYTREQILLGDLMHAIQALEIIAGNQQCLDNTLSDKDIAKLVLDDLQGYKEGDCKG